MRRGLFTMTTIAALLATATTSRASLVTYCLEASSVSASLPGALISPDKLTVTVPPLSTGSLTMKVSVLVPGANGDQTDDGYNGGTWCFYSTTAGGAPKLSGNYTAATLRDTGGQMGVPNKDSHGNWVWEMTEGMGFSAEVYWIGGVLAGSPNDLNGDGDMDWGSRTNSNYAYCPEAGLRPGGDGDPLNFGDWVFGSGSGDLAKIDVGTVTFTWTAPAADGTAASLYPQSFQSPPVSTYVLNDGVMSNIASNSPLIDYGPAVTLRAEAVPEPSTFALAAAGLAALAVCVTKRRKAL
jgi:hypothetical protein